MTKMMIMRWAIPSWVLLAALVVAPVIAEAQTTRSGGQSSPQTRDAKGELREAITVVQQMKKDPELAKVLRQAQGVFLVPDWGRGAFVVGGSGGQGVLLAKKDGDWRGPVFYNLGSLSLGAQAGASAGQLAFILMSDKAVNSFMGDNSFSLNANAGLSIVNWSARSQASLGKSDVIVWSDTEGAYAGVSVSATDINADENANRAFYHTGKANPGAILNGQATASDPVAQQLKQALPA